MKVKIKKFKSTVVVPQYAHPGDAGLDLLALENCILQPGERIILFVGFGLEFPEGYVALIKDKGSLPKNAGIHTMGGVYDAGYRGEYNVNLINLSSEPYHIAAGDKIAQLLIMPVEYAEFELTEELSDSKRGAGRFGSTGK